MQLEDFYIKVAKSTTGGEVLFFGFKKGQYDYKFTEERALGFANFLEKSARMIRTKAKRIGIPNEN